MVRLLFLVLLFSYSNLTQGQVMRLHDSVGVSNLTYIFPITFYKSQCRFALTAINGVGDYIDYSLEQTNCNLLNYKIIIDNYSYDLPSVFDLYYFDTSYSIFELINFGSCSREGGGIITDTNNNTASLFTLSFDVAGAIEYKASPLSPEFIFHSVDGDIVCSNGILVDNSPSVLFVDGFES